MIYDIFNEPLKLCKTKDYKRHDIIYNQGDKPDGLYFVENGLVGLFYISPKGKETFLRVFGNQSILGHRSFFSSEHYHGTAIALSDTKIKHLNANSTEIFLQENPLKLRAILKITSIELGASELRLADQQDKSTNQRIGESLLYLKLKYPKTVWTRKEIGEYSCSTEESVARFMSYCEKEGIIKKIGRDFQVINVKAFIGS